MHLICRSIVLSFLLCVVGCVSDRNVIGQAEDAHKTLEPAVITDPELASYVQAVGDRVVESARRMIEEEGFKKKRIHAEDPAWMYDTTFHLVNSNTLNAFTTGGQHVYLYSELFRAAKTEDEFAAVVAHEFSHIVGRHVKRGMQRQYTILGAAVAVGVGAAALSDDNKLETGASAAGLALVGGQFIGMGFTRKDEAEADKFGFQFYCDAGWDPDAFPGFFQTMIDKGYDTTPELASDHPTLKSRVEAAKKWSAEYKSENPDWQSRRTPPIAGATKFRQLQDRSVAVAKSLPNDATLQAALLMFDSFPSCVAPKDQPRQAEARKELAEIVDEQQDKAKRRSK